MSYSIENLIEQAKTAKDKAHCIYSNFPVGAALVTTTGKIFTGCNVENASYPLTICAERTAVCKAVSEGYKEFIAVAVITNKTKRVKPCGMCRQALREVLVDPVMQQYVEITKQNRNFSKDMIVYSASIDGTYDSHKLSELLPHSFGPEDLNST